MGLAIEVIEPEDKSINYPLGQTLLKQVQTCIQTRNPQVILLDCANVSFVDSAGLAALVRIAKEAQRQGIRFALCSVKNQMATLLRITSMESVFETFEGREQFYEVLRSEFPEEGASHFRRNSQMGGTA
ncbi:MAG: STAS domain-containing protein [Prochlorothrix sp.]|nr:STAS domain-containing protein [Prochlorothrix sp.]